MLPGYVHAYKPLPSLSRDVELCKDTNGLHAIPMLAYNACQDNSSSEVKLRMDSQQAPQRAVPPYIRHYRKKARDSATSPTSPRVLKRSWRGLLGALMWGWLVTTPQRCCGVFSTLFFIPYTQTRNSLAGRTTGVLRG